MSTNNLIKRKQRVRKDRIDAPERYTISYAEGLNGGRYL